MGLFTSRAPPPPFFPLTPFFLSLGYLLPWTVLTCLVTLSFRLSNPQPATGHEHISLRTPCSAAYCACLAHRCRSRSFCAAWPLPHTAQAKGRVCLFVCFLSW